MYLVKTIGAVTPPDALPPPTVPVSSVDAGTLVLAALGGAALTLVGVFAWSRIGGRR